MSRIGNSTITIPQDASFTLDGTSVVIKGPKGELTQTIHPLVTLSQPTSDSIQVQRKDDSKPAKSIHGTTQRLIENMVIGVTQGFEKKLELVGTGYRVAKQGEKLSLSLGFSHPVEFPIPAGINIDIEGNNQISIKGIDKQQVGQVAANIRAFRSPEPYKGKGIRYQGEAVRRKAGKAAKSAA